MSGSLSAMVRGITDEHFNRPLLIHVRGIGMIPSALGSDTIPAARVDYIALDLETGGSEEVSNVVITASSMVDTLMRELELGRSVTIQAATIKVAKSDSRGVKVFKLRHQGDLTMGLTDSEVEEMLLSAAKARGWDIDSRIRSKPSVGPNMRTHERAQTAAELAKINGSARRIEAAVMNLSKSVQGR